MNKKIFTNGKIYTLDESAPLVEAVVVENGRIVDLGSHRNMVLNWGSVDTNIVDLQGNTMTPGLTDSHLHLSGVALRFLELDLTGVKSKNEMLERIKERANSIPKGQWLIGMGWDENLFTDGNIPTIKELDYVAPHCPIFLKRICYHAFLINSKALEQIGYHSKISISHGGSIVLDESTKQPTGLLLESASQLVSNQIPDRSYQELKQGLEQAMKYAIKRGLTSVHTNDPLYLGGFDQTYQMYDELINQENKGLRCNLLIDYPFLSRLRERKMGIGYGNEKLQIGGIKMFADGALGRRTALLSEPYTDDLTQYGEAIQDQASFYEMVKEIRAAEMPIAVHTIGDHALENVLNVLNQFPPVKQRDRIIHASVLNGELISKLAKSSIIVDIQPRFVVSDYPWVIDRIGKNREPYLYPFKTLLSAGVLCAGGSDAPVEPVDPLLGIHAAVSRNTIGNPQQVWNEVERLTIEEALKIFTIGGAYATNEEASKGTISIGKLADMTVFSKDLLSIQHPDELLDTKIKMTIIDGEIQEV
ncbi:MULTISPECIES: amidohydrolase [Bacillus]|uniref:amidohydrolase n=1 Tax=Bacillus TaxID=1386 RepID=UPI0002FA6045|nr:MULTISPECIES: amidohydrolase [Bacillus]